MKKLDGPRFGWLLVGGLTLSWLVAAYLWARSLLQPDNLFPQSAAYRGVLPWFLGISTFTLVVLWGGLIWNWRQRRHAPVPPLNPAELIELDPNEFERHVGLVFRHKGYRVRHRGGSGDHGVDLEVIPPSGRLGIVQCKRYRSTVGEKVVRDLYGTALHEGAAHAFLVTAGDISEAACAWAEGKPITLVDGNRLFELAKKLDK